MSKFAISYDTATNITVTLASLATAAAREAASIDNTTNLYDDAQVTLIIPLQTGTPAAPKCINVYVAASVDGTNWSDNATGADAAITLRAPTNLRLAKVISTPDSGALTYKEIIPSVASLFGGVLPEKWSIIVENQTGCTFNATEANLIKQYRGIWFTVT